MKQVYISLFFIVIFLMSFTSDNEVNSRKTEIVFCLDLSASTNGLLPDIRNNLWQFINNTRNRFPESNLRVAVVVFGRPSFLAKNDYVKILSDFTDEYDLISFRLFQLKTSVETGDQYDGSALRVSIKSLNWSKDATKIIFLFGNGSVKTGGFNFNDACDLAVKENIKINSVYCLQKSVNQKYLDEWLDAAATTGGNFYTYKLSTSPVYKNLSGDGQWLVDLNKELNNTYIYFSPEGKQRFDLMIAADNNSIGSTQKSFYARCLYKSSTHFGEQTAQWDLTGSAMPASTLLENLNPKFLPPEFQKISFQDLQLALVEKKNKRNLLITEMHDAFITLEKDSNNVNQIDSLFMGAIKDY